MVTLYPVSTVCDSPFEQDESYAIQCSTQDTFLPTAEAEMTAIGILLCHLPMERSEVGREREAIGV